MTKLETITAEDLQNRTYEPTHFLVDELIPEGLHILAGAPKIGKSWLALWLCLCVAQGQPLWNFATTQGEVLYLSLEDSFQRIQTRLFDLTADAPSTLHFAIMADTLKRGLEQQIEQFLTEHPDTKLVVIDTLQRVRSAKVQIEDTIFWLLFSGVLLILAVFPGIAYWASSLLGFISPINFVYIVVIFLLLAKQFFMSI